MKKFETKIKKTKLKYIFYCLNFLRIRINIQKTFINIIIELFLQFDKEHLIIPLESMVIYGIIQEIDEFIDFKRNQRNLVEDERSWIFE
jgi:hypothetical protein